MTAVVHSYQPAVALSHCRVTAAATKKQVCTMDTAFGISATALGLPFSRRPLGRMPRRNPTRRGITRGAGKHTAVVSSPICRHPAYVEKGCTERTTSLNTITIGACQCSISDVHPTVYPSEIADTIAWLFQ
jgi:hypothetical protein